ncbi:hypothetical protein [Streptomyces tritici]|uniref:hypothetical protein n=1 Tax=Streptomyces tritici TaxID=2054410 RepID=UPI003AF002F2
MLGIMGAAVVVITGLRNIFDWRHGWARAATTFVAMQHEYVDWAEERGAYDGLSAEASSSLLSTNINAIVTRATSAWAVALTASEISSGKGGS